MTVIQESAAFANYRNETFARMRERVQDAGLVYGGKPIPEIGCYVGALTTGIRDGYQVVELAVLSARGVPQTVRFCPTVDTEPAAFELHGLDRDVLAEHPEITQADLDALLPPGLVVAWAGNFLQRSLAGSGVELEVVDLQATVSDPDATYPLADALLDSMTALPARNPGRAVAGAVRTRALLHALAAP